MGWIIGAAIVNMVWTFWCLQFLPGRIATHFGLNGQPDGFMSRRGFVLFSILFPVALAGFLLYTGSLTKAVPGMPDAMEQMAAGMFFSSAPLTSGSWLLPSNCTS